MPDMQVEYMAHSGDDILVLNAARASFGKETKWERAEAASVTPDGNLWYESVLSDRDSKLLNFLAREKHLLPFRHPQVTLRCRAPLFVARQVGKHQTGMSWSEESRRYITTEPEFYWPDKWRKKADNVKQGSSDEEVTDLTDVGKTTPEYDAMFGGPRAPVNPTDYATRWVNQMLHVYNEMLNSGVAPEQARMILPQNMMITWVWTGSLLSFFHMYKERSHPTAQKETREFAELVREQVMPLYENSWKALMNAN